MVFVEITEVLEFDLIGGWLKATKVKKILSDNSVVREDFMKLIIQILFVLLLVVVGLRTDKGQDLISPYESKVKSILGSQISKYIFQEKEDSGVTIPPLPEIKRDAKNTAIYEKKEQTVEMDDDQRMRLDVAFATELGTVIKRKKVRFKRDQFMG